MIKSFVVAASWAVILVAGASAAEADDDTALLKDAQAAFQPLPKDFATAACSVTPERVELGRKLFFDPRVSVDGTVSCSRCHLAGLQGTDGLTKSHGAHDKVLPRNAPTVFNTAAQFKQHWRGDFANVEAQAKEALIGPGFGNPSFAAAMAKLTAIPGYPEQFEAAFPNQATPVNEGNYATAVGAYERTLVSRSPFDDYLTGKLDAISPAERRGLRVFLDTGCADCHRGVGIGGASFEKFGVVEDYAAHTGSKPVDKGRVDVTKQPDDMYVFKVPPLRNVALSAPYFHDGSVASLTAAIRIMAKVQLGDDLTDQQTNDIAAFLRCLSGSVPKDFAEAPMLPPAAFYASPTGS